MFRRMSGGGRRFRVEKKPKHSRKRTGEPERLLDASVLIDGRILDIRRTGFLSGALLVPEFVREELRQAALSTDQARHARGERGTEVLSRLQASGGVRVIAGEDLSSDHDAALLQLAARLEAPVVTADPVLQKAAAAAGVRVLNVNELAGALRPMILTGERLSLAIAREGREAAQGVGYLEDGTMVVVEGGKPFVGQKKQVTVTSVLQTSAGRMVFAKVSAED